MSCNPRRDLHNPLRLSLSPTKPSALEPSIPGRLQIGVLLAASSLSPLAGAIVAPALPDIRTAFAGTPGVELMSRLVIGLPALAVALFGSFTGTLSGRWGRKHVLLVGLILYGFSGTSGLWLNALGPLLIGRFGLGIAVAAIMTSASTLLADAAQGPTRARLLAAQATTMGIGGLVFVAAGGFLAEWSWRGPFVVYFAAWLLAPMVTRGLPNETLHAENTTATVPPPKQATMLLGFATAGMLMFFILPVQIPFVLTEAFGARSSTVGIVLAVGTLVSASASLSFPRLSGSLTPPSLLAISFSLMGLGTTLIAAASSIPLVACGVGIVGGGTGLLIPNLTSWTANLVSSQALGRAIGRLTSAVFVGQFLSPFAVSPLLLLGVPLQATFFAGTGLALIALAFALRTSRWPTASASPRVA